MKRELKEYVEPRNLVTRLYVTRHIPMKRELKVVDHEIDLLGQRSHKAYPDEKGTESQTKKGQSRFCLVVTRHIPMKRELKVFTLILFSLFSVCCHKAYPDEKGTESKTF